MPQSKITLIGMEKFLNPERSVFDNMILPDGIDRDTLIGTIIMRCQEFELLYSDPDFMTAAVNIWSRKNYRTFDKWVKALNIEYEPLYNYDRTEEYTDEHKGSFDNKANGSSTQTNNLTETRDLTGSNDSTTTGSSKAYNDADLIEKEETVLDQDTTEGGTVTNTGTVGNVSNTGENGSDEYTNIHKARMFGNIGVTTSQQMLQSELDLARWNLYEHIADLFASEFCIMIY